MASPLTIAWNVTTLTRPKSLLNIFEYILWLDILGFIYGSLNFFGIVTNLINLRTFMKMGVTGDGVSLAFFLLAKSDLGLCCSSLIICVMTYFVNLESKDILSLNFEPANTTSLKFITQVDPTLIAIFAMSVMKVFSITTIFITLYLAVTRCLCVTRPLQFRNIVSVKKTIIVVSSFFLFALGSRLPIWPHMGAPITFNSKYNASRPMLWLHPNYRLIKDIIRIYFYQMITAGTQITLFVCVIIMARRLRQAHKFRKSASVAKEFSDINEDKSNNSSLKLNTKDARIIQQLIVISSIFVVCNMPKLTRDIGTISNPSFGIGGIYQSFYYIVSVLVNICDVLNSSTNVFVYHRYNSSFRKKVFVLLNHGHHFYCQR